MLGAGELLVSEGEGFRECGFPGKLGEEESWYGGSCRRHSDSRRFEVLQLMDVEVGS